MTKQDLINIQNQSYSFQKPKEINPLEHRVVLRNYGIIDPLNINHYIAKNGYFALYKAIQDTPQNVLDEVILSDIRGRGGVGFPTGLKWKFTKNQQSQEKYIICNADEGEPGTFMDKHILEGDPHSVIEGMIIAGYSIGATMGYIYIRAEYPKAISIFKHAIKKAIEYNFLGTNIMGTSVSFNIEIRQGAGAFICGEETSLLESIEGNRGESRNKPPYPAQSGLFGQPTVVNNVETLSNIPQIILKGGEWFKKMGTEKSSGTKILSLSGKINIPGIYEVEMGITLRQIIEELGGGIKSGSIFQYAVSGGPSGGFLTKEHFDIPIDFDSLLPYDSLLGSGGIIIFDQNDCIIDTLNIFMKFNQEESCGKCTPCREGTNVISELLKSIQSMTATKETLSTIKHLGRTMQRSSLCGLGQAAPNPIFSALRYFEEVFNDHIVNHVCYSNQCHKVVRK